MVHHDPEIRGAGPIALLSTAEVVAARLTNGEPVPLLSDVLNLTVLNTNGTVRYSKTVADDLTLASVGRS